MSAYKQFEGTTFLCVYQLLLQKRLVQKKEKEGIW